MDRNDYYGKQDRILSAEGLLEASYAGAESASLNLTQVSA